MACVRRKYGIPCQPYSNKCPSHLAHIPTCAVDTIAYLERLVKAKKELEAQVDVMSAQAVQDAARMDHLASHSNVMASYSNVMSAQAVQDAARMDHLASHSNVMSAVQDAAKTNCLEARVSQLAAQLARFPHNPGMHFYGDGNITPP